MADHNLISTQELSRHNSPKDCWIVVSDRVWDVTDFLDEHPGGSAGVASSIWSSHMGAC